MSDKPTSTLTLEEQSVVDQISSGAIKTYGDWMLLHYCQREYPTQYARPVGTPQIADEQQHHMYNRRNGVAEYYYLKDRIQSDVAIAEVYQFAALLKFLERHGYVAQTVTVQMSNLRLGRATPEHEPIYGDIETNKAIQLAYNVLGVNTRFELPALSRITIGRLPSITMFIVDGYVTLDQVEHQMIVDANARADKANTRSTWIAVLALVTTLLTVGFQIWGTSKVSVEQPKPQVIRVPILNSPASTERQSK